MPLRVIRALGWALPALLLTAAAPGDARPDGLSFERWPVFPGPLRDRGEAAVKANEACEGCHDDEARAWRGSLHQRAMVNSAFRAALAVEPTAFCWGCHAPESGAKAPPSERVEGLGVGCVSCHRTHDGGVLAAPRQGSAPEEAPHPIHRSAEFATTAGCKGCHEFRFPGLFSRGDEAFMQTTVREHARSASAKEPCATCHMPREGGRRSHSFSNVRDPAWLRASLAAEADREGGSLRLTLTQTSPGHAFPTGDLFRRLVVGCEVLNRAGERVRVEERYLDRRFELLPGGMSRTLTADERVESAPKTLEFSIDPADKPASVVWWVTYQRVATVGKGDDPKTALIESEVPLHRGVLPWR